MGYVQQQDVFIGTVTVREALAFSANLRLPATTTRAQRAAMVEETLHLLNLSHVANVLIGDDSVRRLCAAIGFHAAHGTAPLHTMGSSSAFFRKCTPALSTKLPAPFTPIFCCAGGWQACRPRAFPPASASC